MGKTIHIGSSNRLQKNRRFLSSICISTAHYIIIIIEEKNKDALKLNKTSNVKFNWQKVIDTGYAWAIYNIDASVGVESCDDIKFGVIVAGYRLNVSVQSCGYPAGFQFTGM